MGQAVSPPTRRAAAIAVIENPFAGRYVEDLSPLIAIGEELGELLSKRAVAALGIEAPRRRVTARPPRSARTANWNMPLQYFIRKWVRRSEKCCTRARH